MSESLQALDQVKATAIDMGIKFGPRLLVAGIILLVGYMAGRWAGVMVTRLLARFKLEAPVRQLIARLVQLFVLCLFVIMAMQNLGSNCCRWSPDSASPARASRWPCRAYSATSLPV